MTKARPSGAADSGNDVFHRLRDGITSGQFQPNERLVEANLTRLLGAGRTAIRAALVRLDQEGLVTRELNRGARVRLVSESEALEIEEARSALERLLCRHAATKATAPQVRRLKQMIDEMRKCLEAGDAVGYSELNPGFHQLIWTCAQHGTASRLVLNLKSQSIRFQYHTMLRPGRPQRSLSEHEAIYRAIAGRDPDAAENAMREHLEEVLETLRWAIKHQERSPRWLSR